MVPMIVTETQWSIQRSSRWTTNETPDAFYPLYVDLFKYPIIQLQKWCCARPKNNGRGHCRQQILFWAWEILLQPLVTILFCYFGQSPLRNVATARWLSPSCHSPLFCGPRRRGTELMQILSDRININIIIFTIIPTIIHAIIHAWQV